MSHSKQTKRGFFLYPESRNKSAKKYVNTCAICGKRGYSPVIEAEDFPDWVVRRELTATLPPMGLDELGRCADCARVQEKHRPKK